MPPRLQLPRPWRSGPSRVVARLVRGRSIYLPLSLSLSGELPLNGILFVRTGMSSYTGEGCHLGGIIGIPWSGPEAGLGVLIRAFLFSSASPSP